jgi:hypothetical protein
MSRAHIPAALERQVWDRSRSECEYCRSLIAFHSDPFAIDHIVPKAKGGATDEANLALACLGCNGFKGPFLTGLDPVTETEVSLFHPRFQRWTKHFAWNGDTTQIIGITATGRATVVRLRLNRPGLIRLRAALNRFGVHPPALSSEELDAT